MYQVPDKDIINVPIRQCANGTKRCLCCFASLAHCRIGTLTFTSYRISMFHFQIYFLFSANIFRQAQVKYLFPMDN